MRLLGGDWSDHSVLVKERRRRTMEFLCGLDVAIDETAVCVVNETARCI